MTRIGHNPIRDRWLEGLGPASRRETTPQTPAPQSAPVPKKVAHDVAWGRLRHVQAAGGPGIQDQVRASFQSQFGRLASDKTGFHAFMRDVYGPNYDVAAAENFRQRALRGDYSWLPRTEFRSDETLRGGNGAYDASRNVIYINERFWNDPARAAKVFTEEVGHFLDTKLNRTDTRGDEGEMFRRLLSGERLTAAERAAIRSDNDHGTIVVDGKVTEVEYSIFDDIWNGVKKVGGAIADGVSRAASAVGNAVSSAARAVGNAVRGVGEAVWNGVSRVGNAVADAAKWVTPRLWDAASGLVGGAFNAAAGAFQNVLEGLGTFAGGIGKFFSGDFLGGLKDMGLGLVKTLLQTPADAILMLGGRAVSAIQTMLGLEPPGRKLSDAEIAELRKVYGDSIDYSAVRIKEGDAGLFSTTGRAFTHGNTIYVPKKDLPLSNDLLVHEMAHVWQNQHGGTDYMSEALWAQNVGDGYDFEKGIDEGKSWSELNPEQQAELMQQAYLSGYFDPSSPNYGKFVYDGKDYTEYLKRALAQMRAGQGAP